MPYALLHRRLNTDWDYADAGQPDEDQLLLQRINEKGETVAELELAYFASRMGESGPTVEQAGSSWTFPRVLSHVCNHYRWIPLEQEELFPRSRIADQSWEFGSRLTSFAELSTLDQSTTDPILVLHEDPELWVTLQKDLSVELVALTKVSPRLMQKMNSDAFEKLVLELMASSGHHVEWIGRRKDISGDGIVTAMRASDTNKPILVEAKRYAEDNTVGVVEVVQLLGAMALGRFTGGLLATCSYFKDSVRRRIGDNFSVELVDRDGLEEWLREYSPKESLYSEVESSID